MESIGTRDSDHGPQGKPRGGSFLASCTYCQKLHRADPLEFNPVCAICAAERATMRCLEMKGSFPLSDAAIAAELTRTSPGNYALGYLEDGSFVVFYVGRSDSDLKQRLQDWVGTPSRYDRYAASGMAPWGSRRRGPSPLTSPALGRVGQEGHSSYTHFAYSYASSAETALQKEHRNYDDFGGRAALDNEGSPARGSGSAATDPAHRSTP